MADEKKRPTATRMELYSVASTLCVLSFMVLIASSKSEDHWLRIVTMVMAISLQILYVVASLLSKRPEKAQDPEKPS
jgi:Na+/melibiose symporter-like transporter